MHSRLTVQSAQHAQLTQPWRVWAIPRNAETPANGAPPPDALVVPVCTHLQLALYPDRPYWGDHLRTLNETDWFYYQTFTVENSTDHYRRVRLKCEGIDYYAAIWLNGQFVGQHEGNFAPFSFDITDAIRPDAENALLIRVNSPWDPPTKRGSYPIDHVLRGLVKGLYEHGEGVIPPNVNPLGVWRPVGLVLDDGVSVDHVRIRAGIDGRVDLALRLTNATGEHWHGSLVLNVVAENHDGPGTQHTMQLELPPGTQTINPALVIREPRLWWPWDQGDPSLYRLTVQLNASDGRRLSTQDEIFGLRTVELERSPERFTYRINGRPVFLRGTSYMPDFYLSRCSRESIAKDIDWARQANLNLLRVHVHVSPPDVYDLCNRAGMLIWQDFELSWVHDPSLVFEARALALQHEMIDLLGNHPAIMTWTCHNEPTMVLARRENLEGHPDPALYEAAKQQDPTRPVFICSGQMDQDWQRAGDTHCYYGGIWSRRYTDVYPQRIRLGTEFGFEAPAALSTLKAYPEAWERLKHLEEQIDELWQYQAELVQYYIEHFRRLRAESCGGYVHFWLADLFPQTGCGVLDVHRQPKGGYEALKRASQPLQVALEHDGRYPQALWVFNDTPHTYPGSVLDWAVYNAGNQLVQQGSLPCNIPANASQRITAVQWNPTECAQIKLSLRTAAGDPLASNSYAHPFQPTPRPRGYPWKFDPVLGCKVFDRPDAPSLADLSSSKIVRLIPLSWREGAAEWALRQQLPLWAVSLIARVGKVFTD